MKLHTTGLAALSLAIALGLSACGDKGNQAAANPDAAGAALAAGFAAAVLAAGALALFAALAGVGDLTDFADFVAGMYTLRSKKTHKENWQAPLPAHTKNTASACNRCKGQLGYTRYGTSIGKMLGRSFGMQSLRYVGHLRWWQIT